MSARKLNNDSVFQPVVVQAREKRLQLNPKDVSIRKNGVEFRSPAPIELWNEMTVDLEVPGEARKVHCTGVVVACAGNRHSGFQVTMAFTRMTQQSETRLKQIAFSRLT
jgi:hypothetical protein